MTGMLASVMNLAEAKLALAAGVEIIDLKSPKDGALGALPVAEIQSIMSVINHACPVSATIGDLPMEAQGIRVAVEETAATGVDYVKVGFFPGGDWDAVIEALTQLANENVALVAVLIADQLPDFQWIGKLAKAGFRGVMLDTQDKAKGSLIDFLSIATLTEFVHEVRLTPMLCGLAGSLRLSDLAPLVELNPDYLGFRGALCEHQQRSNQLSADAIKAVRLQLRQATELCKI